MATYISRLYGNNCEISLYTDDVDRKSTSYDGIVQKLYDLAISSYRDNLEFAWIHYSGHGSYQKDSDGDEADGYDEGFVPSDYETKGILIDDVINKVISCFNPKTKILFISDCCHSGSILDLRYGWSEDMQCVVENKKCTVRAPVIMISGCRDSQTSADAYDLLGDHKSIGALTASIVNVLRKYPKYVNNIFAFIHAVRNELYKGGFEQYPCLSSTYDITKNPSMVLQIAQTRDIRPSYSEAPNTYSLSANQCHTPIQAIYPTYITYIPMIYGYNVSI
jgi:hypothetical protein